jgi:hypothetical protein
MSKKQRKLEMKRRAEYRKLNALNNSKLTNNNKNLEQKITQTFDEQFIGQRPVYEPFIFSISDEEINRLIFKCVMQYTHRMMELKPKKTKSLKTVASGKDL